MSDVSRIFFPKRRFFPSFVFEKRRLIDIKAPTPVNRTNGYLYGIRQGFGHPGIQGDPVYALQVDVKTLSLDLFATVNVDKPKFLFVLIGQPLEKRQLTD